MSTPEPALAAFYMNGRKRTQTMPGRVRGPGQPGHRQRIGWPEVCYPARVTNPWWCRD